VINFKRKMPPKEQPKDQAKDQPKKSPSKAPEQQAAPSEKKGPAAATDAPQKAKETKETKETKTDTKPTSAPKHDAATPAATTEKKSGEQSKPKEAKDTKTENKGASKSEKPAPAKEGKPAEKEGDQKKPAEKKTGGQKAPQKKEGGEKPKATDQPQKDNKGESKQPAKSVGASTPATKEGTTNNNNNNNNNDNANKPQNGRKAKGKQQKGKQQQQQKKDAPKKEGEEAKEGEHKVDEEEPPALEEGQKEGAEGQKTRKPKVNRGEQKNRKALSKMGLKAFTGITKVTLKMKQGVYLTVETPEIMKNPGSDSYLVFGDIKINDPQSNFQQAAQMLASKAGNKPGAAPATGTEEQPPALVEETKTGTEKKTEKPSEKKKEEKPAAAAPAEKADETGLDPKDIELVMTQANCSRGTAVAALRKTNGDVVNAIVHVMQ